VCGFVGLFCVYIGPRQRATQALALLLALARRGALLRICRALLQTCMVLLQMCTALLRICGALFWICVCLWRICRAMLQIFWGKAKSDTDTNTDTVGGAGEVLCCGHVWFFCGHVLFFCRCTQLFCGYVGLFCGYAGLFCGYIRMRQRVTPTLALVPLVALVRCSFADMHISFVDIHGSSADLCGSFADMHSSFADIRALLWISVCLWRICRALLQIYEGKVCKHVRVRQRWHQHQC